jgi:hypothetical protein
MYEVGMLDRNSQLFTDGEAIDTAEQFLKLIAQWGSISWAAAQLVGVDRVAVAYDHDDDGRHVGTLYELLEANPKLKEGLEEIAKLSPGLEQIAEERGIDPRAISRFVASVGPFD